MNTIQHFQNKVRVFLFSLLPVSFKNTICNKIASSSITDSHVNNTITVIVGISGLFVYKLLHNHPHLLSIFFSLYPIHITISYTKIHRPLPLEIRKIIMTWFYFVLWDNITFLIKDYPIARITGYTIIIIKKYEDSQWTIGDYVMEKHSNVIDKLNTYKSNDDISSMVNETVSDTFINENPTNALENENIKLPIKTD